MNFVRKSYRRNLKHLVTYFLVCCLVFNIPLSAVLADVVLTDVVNGNITVNSGPNTTNMTASNGAIGQFSDFDIAATQSVFCAQPGADARALFEVFSGDGTQIYGRFEATGSIYLHDAAGILIGPGAVINMTQLVATSLNLSHEDFLNGRDIFAGGNAAVINEGNISAQKVALIGKKVLNTGTITSPNGYVVMAAGDKVVLGQPGSNVIVELNSIDIPETAGSALADMADVANEGTIDAQEGMIVLAAGDVFSKALNLGTISAAGGTVTAKAARVGQFGTINTDGIEAGGGSVNLTAGEAVALSSDSLTTANGGTNGDGGRVVVYSPDTALLRSGARIEVKGGSESGDGGFVEISGKEHVQVNGTVDRTAVNGQSGMLLIDPANILITDNDVDDPTWTNHDFAPTVTGHGSEIDIDTLEIHLVGGNTTINTTSGLSEPGNVTFAARRNVANNTDHSLTVNADGDINIKKDSGFNFTGGGDLTMNTDTNDDGIGGTINLNADILAHNVQLNGQVQAYGIMNRRIEAQKTDSQQATLSVNGNITKYGAGKLILAGEDGINLAGDVTGDGGNHVVFENVVYANGSGSQRFDAQTGTLTAKGSITKTTEGNLSLYAEGGIDLDGTAKAQDGSLIIANEFTAKTDLVAQDSVILLDDGVFDGEADQLVEATNGTVTTHGWLRKTEPGDLTLRGGSDELAIDLHDAGPGNGVSTCCGNIIIEGNGDVQIGVDLITTLRSSCGGDINKRPNGPSELLEPGGVSIISENGKIYTEDRPNGNGLPPDLKNGINNTEYALNTTIEGYSNHVTDAGVDLPYGEGKAAIVLMSKEDLNLGEDSFLKAEGLYYGNKVDDRGAIDFFDESASIGGHNRKQGEAIDVAIYAASTEGNVEANGGMAVTFPFPTKAQYPELSTGATVVLDAKDTVSFAPEGLRTFGSGTFSLQVCSRRTEWLKDAVANVTLPFAGNPSFMSTFLGVGYDYVLRGAGLDNPAIDDGRAWVLEDPSAQEPAHLDAMAYFQERPPFEVEDECPALVAWAAEELGLQGGIQTYLSGAYVYTTDLQPCEMCARLRDSATIMADEDGTQIAALGVVINEFVSPPVPISTEQMASIGQALALHTDDGTHYAAAAQWLDALVEYIGILNSEIGWSMADSVAFATTRYVAPATAEADAAVVAYIEAQLAGLGG